MGLGRINIQYRRVECVPPSNLVVFADQNYGQDKWLRLFVEVRKPDMLYDPIQCKIAEIANLLCKITGI